MAGSLSGCTPNERMRVTGHKGTKMLARTYHPRPEDLARKLGENNP